MSKKIVPIFQADIIDKGILKVSPPVKREMALWCLTFKPGTRVDITIRKHSEKRSDLQNQYYWGVVIAILADHFGYEPEELHEELKIMFNPVESKIRPGQIIGGSTTKLSTEEFFSEDQSSYIERIRRYFAQPEYNEDGEVIRPGIYIPDPQKADSQ